MVTDQIGSLEQIPEESHKDAMIIDSKQSLDLVPTNTMMELKGLGSLGYPGLPQLETSRFARKENAKFHHRLQSLDSVLQTEYPLPYEQPPKTPATKLSTGDNAAASMIASYRRSIRRAEAEQPTIPIRTTSTARPAKRKRHGDYVAFHRQSCQLFSSLDNTLAQMRLPTSLSSSSSSTSSSRSSTSSTPSSTPSSPALESDTRDTSMDFDVSGPESSPPAVPEEITKPLNLKRPTLQRMPCSISLSPSIGVESDPHISQSAYASLSTTNRNQPANDASPPPSIPPKTTTQSCYSSQITLPTPPTRTTTSNTNTNTVIHWTSPETRAREYAKIDAANSGFRLFLRRVCPHALAKKVGGGRPGFWDDCHGHNSQTASGRFEDGSQDPDDCGGSVRRYRVETVDPIDTSDHNDDSDGVSEEDGTDIEKEAKPHRLSSGGITRSLSLPWIPFSSRARNMDPQMSREESASRSSMSVSVSMIMRRMSSYRL